MGELLTASHGVDLFTIPEGAPERIFGNMTFRLLATREQIAEQAARIGSHIYADYKEVATDRQPLVCLNILEGASMWCWEVAPNIGSENPEDPALPIEVASIRVSSYGSGITSSGIVTSGGIDPKKVEGKHVVLMDDVRETLNTTVYLYRTLLDLGAASVAGAYAFNKTDVARRKSGSEDMPKYIGFNVLNPYLIGHGMDLAGRHRNLPDVWQRVEAQAAN